MFFVMLLLYFLADYDFYKCVSIVLQQKIAEIMILEDKMGTVVEYRFLFHHGIHFSFKDFDNQKCQ